MLSSFALSAFQFIAANLGLLYCDDEESSINQANPFVTLCDMELTDKIWLYYVPGITLMMINV